MHYAMRCVFIHHRNEKKNFEDPNNLLIDESRYITPFRARYNNIPNVENQYIMRSAISLLHHLIIG